MTSGTEVDQVLQERGSNYGPFWRHSEITQKLKAVVNEYVPQAVPDPANPGATEPFLTADQQEALDMIFHKIGRIVNGNPNYADSWLDISGYSKLIYNRLNGDSI